MFESWFRLVAAGAEMARAAIHTGEAVVAADRVMRSRSTTIADAFDNPFGADYAELARLVPEKILASTRAAGDVAVETLAIWSAAIVWSSTLKPLSSRRLSVSISGRPLSRT